MDLLPALPVALPLLVAAALVGLAPVCPRPVADAAAVLTAALVTLACLALLAISLDGPVVYWFGGWTPRGGIALGVAFAVDPVGAALATLAGVLATAALTFSWRIFEAVRTLHHGLMLVFLAGIVGFCLSGDLFNMFVFYELFSVAAYALAGYQTTNPGSVRGALNFAITNSVGAILVLGGIALLYGRTGALNLAQLGQSLARGPADRLVVAAFLLLMVGFFVKAAVVPFHFWLADAYSVAPTPVCMLLSAAMSELGLYALARVYWTCFSGVLGPHEQALQIVLICAGTLTALVGASMCFGSRHLKRMLAYATIAHVGLFLIGFALFDSGALAGVALFVVADGFLKAALFVSVGSLQHLFHTVDELRLRGQATRLRVTGALVAVCALCVASLPPFGPWLGKALIEEAAGDAGYGWLPVVFVFVSALTGGAVLRAAGRVFLGLGPEHDPITEDAFTGPDEVDPELRYRHDRVPRTMTIPALALVAAGVAVGLVPGLRDAALEAGARFVDRSAYAASVLRGAPDHAESFDSIHPTLLNVLSGLFTVALAAYFAGAALFRERMPLSLGWSERLGAGVVARLRTFQTSNAGDYVTWLTLGAATLAAIFALTLTT
ncbi:MAG: complex I subunit 5 family protein [Actinomycetes bacterium]